MRAPLTFLAALLAGCAVLPAAAREPAAECLFPLGTELSFSGETTLGDVGLAAPGGESVRAYVWITAGPIDTFGDGVMNRIACADLGDGQFISATYPVPQGPVDGG